MDNLPSGTFFVERHCSCLSVCGAFQSQFNFVNIMIQPLDRGTNCVTVQTKPEVEEMIGHNDTKLISDANLPYLVRQMAVHADVRIAEVTDVICYI